MFKPGTKVEVHAEVLRRYKNISVHPQMTWKPGTVVKSLGHLVQVRIVDRNKTVFQVIATGVWEIRRA